MKKIVSTLQWLGWHTLYYLTISLSLVVAFFLYGNGVCEGWVISSKRIFDVKIKAAKLIRHRTDILCAANKVWRLQTTVKANFKMGLRFAEFLGFKNEGLMRGYGPDKSDYYRMAKVYL